MKHVDHIARGKRKVYKVMSESKSQNVVWHEHGVSVEELEALHGHKGTTVWFTGLPSSGKSTLANAVARILLGQGVSTIVLDGDNIRHGLNNNLGFSPKDRTENIRRIGEVAKLFTSAAVINLTAFISPYESDRQAARVLQPDTFVEVYCDASLEVCEKRDPKGFYRKARAGEIKGFTGIDAPYEPPLNPEIHLHTGSQSVELCVDTIVQTLRNRGVLSRGFVSSTSPDLNSKGWI